MIYRKNIYRWEQWARVGLGVTAVIGGLYFVPVSVFGYAALGVGVVMVTTGLLGWCPACALVGRRIRGSE